MSASLLESAQNLLAGLLDLGRTRFELFGTELREELARLAATVLGGLAVLVLVALGLAFGAAAFILTVSEANRIWATFGVAALFLLAGGIVALQVRRMTGAKPRAFDATLSELERDLNGMRP
ncbi:MAG TPA: phage holin family protein [Burkholderiales bacterium]|nr:phage holin family protein [Burkholderiales bacterium]